jgi:hypothetical protein
MSRWTKPRGSRVRSWLDVFSAVWWLALGIAWLFLPDIGLLGVGFLLLGVAWALKAVKVWPNVELDGPEGAVRASGQGSS